jgi:hypothetical protein
MMLIEISNINEHNGAVVNTDRIVAQSPGAAFDHKAPDPREGTQWKIEIIARDVEVHDG